MGFSLLEVLIVVAILGILLIAGMFFMQRHLMRARDAQRKSDLDRIRTAFEEYYNDYRCYPAPGYLTVCGSTALSPYLKEIPCDPLTKEPYAYFGLNGNVCSGYRILVKLEIQNDQDILTIGCDFTEGCGWEENPEYNYGVAAGAPVGYFSWEPAYGGSVPGFIDPSIGHYACVYQTNSYSCYLYTDYTDDNFEAMGCSQVFASPDHTAGQVQCEAFCDENAAFEEYGECQ